jgi:hypothetical protein
MTSSYPRSSAGATDAQDLLQCSLTVQVQESVPGMPARPGTAVRLAVPLRCNLPGLASSGSWLVL